MDQGGQGRDCGGAGKRRGGAQDRRREAGRRGQWMEITDGMTGERTGQTGQTNREGGVED